MKEKKKVYLTKRIMERASHAAVNRAAKRTMAVMGYNVVVVNNRVAKKFADGRIEYIGSLSSAHNTKVILD